MDGETGRVLSGERNLGVIFCQALGFICAIQENPWHTLGYGVKTTCVAGETSDAPIQINYNS